MSAVGALCGSEVRNTAVPATLTGGLLSNVVMRSLSGIASLFLCSEKIRVPFNQVNITIETIAARVIGSHPPSRNLSRLAARNVASMIVKGAIRAVTRNGDRLQIFRETRNAMKVVTSITPLVVRP
jgi:hypothetical protein